MFVKSVLLCLFLFFGTSSCFVPSTTSFGFKSILEDNSKIRIEPVRRNRQHSNLNAWNPFKSNTAEIAVIEETTEQVLEPGPFDIKNGIAALTWLALVTWAFLFAPGELASASDNALINILIEQPSPRPDNVNEIWFAVWNFFVIVPATVGALAAPTSRLGQRLPATPFLWGASFFGFFSLGPYFATRTDRSSDVVTKEDLGWATRNILENRLFGVALAAIALSIPFSSDIVVPDFNWGQKIAEYQALFASSRFVAVASIDIILMSIVNSVLITEDCKLRGWDDKAIPFGVGSLLLPGIGPALYLAARPSLPSNEE